MDSIIERFTSILAHSGVIDQIKSMYLFGSRSRDDWRPDSDYDLLIVVDKKDREMISNLYDAVMDTLLDTGRLLSLKIFTEQEYTRLKSIPTPFMENVMKEPIKLELRH
jgi:predicted nucleotidyltransferase